MKPRYLAKGVGEIGCALGRERERERERERAKG